MTPEEEKELLEKLDTMTKKIELLENPPEPEGDQKEDEIDPRIEKAEAIMRLSLKGSFSDEKLAEMKFDALEIAMNLKADFKPPKGMKPPTGSGTQKQDTHSNVPDAMRAHFGSEMNYGELIK